jgi:hypothetical protein
MSIPSTTPQQAFTPATTSSPPSLTDSEDGSVLATDSAHHPSKHTPYNTVSNESVIMISTTSDDTDTNAPDTARNPKKLKMSASSGDREGKHSDISVLDIEDIKDTDDKQLNRSEPQLISSNFLQLSLASWVNQNDA